MSESEVIEERAGYRVRIVRDESPEAPEDEFGFPVFVVSYYRDGSARFTDYGDDVLDAGPALQRFIGQYGASDGMTAWERWLAIWHDGKVCRRGDLDQSADYLAYTCRELAAKHGIPDESNVPQLDEYAAYVEGDVWGYVVERKTFSQIIERVPGTREVLSDYTADTWHEEEAIWGFYGRKHAEEEARSALAGFAPVA